jgi:predicted Fe-Mo cluster-binding NifX family protein
MIAETASRGLVLCHQCRRVLRGVTKRNIGQIALIEETLFNEKTILTLKQKENNHMRIAIPLANGKLSVHFGHCAHFALVDVDATEKKVLKREDIEAPPHAPGLLPPWLAERGVTMIIAGGMGQRAQDMFSEQGIAVLVGATAESPENLVAGLLEGTLQTGENVCDH